MMSSDELIDNDGNGLDESKTAGRWTLEEHELFLQGLEVYNKQWKLIADMVKTRTVVQIRTHAQKYFQKIKKMTVGPNDETVAEHIPPKDRNQAHDPSMHSILEVEGIESTEFFEDIGDLDANLSFGSHKAELNESFSDPFIEPPYDFENRKQVFEELFRPQVPDPTVLNKAPKKRSRDGAAKEALKSSKSPKASSRKQAFSFTQDSGISVVSSSESLQTNICSDDDLVSMLQRIEWESGEGHGHSSTAHQLTPLATFSTTQEPFFQDDHFEREQFFLLAQILSEDAEDNADSQAGIAVEHPSAVNIISDSASSDMNRDSDDDSVAITATEEVGRGTQSKWNSSRSGSLDVNSGFSMPQLTPTISTFLRTVDEPSLNPQTYFNHFQRPPISFSQFDGTKFMSEEPLLGNSSLLESTLDSFSPGSRPHSVSVDFDGGVGLSRLTLTLPNRSRSATVDSAFVPAVSPVSPQKRRPGRPRKSSSSSHASSNTHTPPAVSSPPAQSFEPTFHAKLEPLTKEFPSINYAMDVTEERFSSDMLEIFD